MGERDKDAAEAGFQIVIIFRQAEDGHDFGSGGDIESRFARHALQNTAQADDDIPEGAVVHVHDPFPGDAAWINSHRFLAVNSVVEEGGQKVMSGSDGVEITREVEIDFVSGVHLAQTSAGSAALHAQARAEGRFAQGNTDGLSHLRQGLSQSDGRGGLAFARRSGGDGGDQNQFASGRMLFKNIEMDLGLGGAIGNPILCFQSQLGSDLGDGSAFEGCRIVHEEASLKYRNPLTPTRSNSAGPVWALGMKEICGRPFEITPEA